MTKDEFNSLFREHAKVALSPTQKERDFVTNIYSHICNALNGNCIQIGSFPRFTSIHPLHDLDVLYVIGDMSSFTDNPCTILSDLKKTLQDYFYQNTNFKIKVELQTHSITLILLNTHDEEYFAIDVVPACIRGQNEFNLDTYMVPEIIKTGRRKRLKLYQSKRENHSSITWIKSDPRGYIKIAENINKSNGDYRKAVKFAKRWKHNVADITEDFKFKSFHIEQLFVKIFLQNPNIDMFDAIFTFFCHIPKFISNPQIQDRADANLFIDSYLNELTEEQKQLIIQARDKFLITLEDFTKSSPISNLLNGQPYKRFSKSEVYLFDVFIPTLTEDAKFKIDGWVRKKNGFRCGWLSDIEWKIETDRFIEFSIRGNDTKANIYKWKVKNDNLSPDPRGEIMDCQTKNYPESTKYRGNHFVECYAIKDGVCIARHKIDVTIGNT